ncbi:MAG: RNA polymerase sigma-70 factor [Flavobacterium sp.]|nr:MAG: RNA polymerase sigma-70 factor [Flavobacterium sp.]
MTEEDFDIIDALKKQDKRRFELFYKKYYRPLLTVAYRYVENTEIAEEIVHDVFITIWNKAGQLNIQSSMKSYLFRSIVNSSLNHIKKEKKQLEKQSAFKIAQERDLENGTGETNEADEVLLKGLEDALALLPEKCKQVMYLSRFGKLKQQDIADQMEISIKTVKNHLTYGFKKLREHIEKHQQLIIWVMLLLKLIMP